MGGSFHGYVSHNQMVAMQNEATHRGWLWLRDGVAGCSWLLHGFKIRRNAYNKIPWAIN